MKIMTKQKESIKIKPKDTNILDKKVYTDKVCKSCGNKKI